MREYKKIQILQALQFASLLLVIGSCTNSNHEKNQSANPSSEAVTDTTLQLNFTSMVRSIFEDSRGNYWIGSDKEGVCKYDGKSFTYFTANDGLGHNQIRTIQEDKDGTIWFSTGSTITSYDGEQFTIHISRENSDVSNIEHYSGGLDTNGLWFQAFDNNGAYNFDGQKLSFLEFPVTENSYGNPYFVTGITNVTNSKSNTLWFATYAGVIGYDGKSFNVIDQKNIDYHVRGILGDSKGHVWIGNNGIGILVYDGEKTIKLSEKKELHKLPKENFPYHVFTVAEDNNGNIWIGDRDTGAWCYDGISLKNYTTIDGLTSMFVRVICNDKKGQLWFGLEGGGVCKFNGTSFDRIY